MVKNEWWYLGILKILARSIDKSKIFNKNKYIDEFKK